MFCNKSLHNTIDRVHKRCLRAITRKYDCSLPELLSGMNLTSIHTKHIHSLLTEVFKSLNRINPDFINELFKIKTVPYQLRKSKLLVLPSVKSTTYGTNSVLFQACLQWNNLPIEGRNCTTVGSFKRFLTKSKFSLVCTCRLCKFI